MNITLDHNCLINVANETEDGECIRQLIDTNHYTCFIVNIGASEIREKGVRPDRYDLFERFLEEIGLDHLERLNPVGVYDLTFYDQCIYAGEKDQELLNHIEEILFPIPLNELAEDETFDSELGKKHINRLCDIHSMWCHINYGNDIFLTSDKNFMKKTKVPKLIEIGAKQISKPCFLD